MELLGVAVLVGTYVALAVWICRWASGPAGDRAAWREYRRGVRARERAAAVRNRGNR